MSRLLRKLNNLSCMKSFSLFIFNWKKSTEWSQSYGFGTKGVNYDRLLNIVSCQQNGRTFVCDDIIKSNGGSVYGEGGGLSLTVGEEGKSCLVTAAWYMAIRSLRGVDSTILTPESRISVKNGRKGVRLVSGVSNNSTNYNGKKVCATRSKWECETGISTELPSALSRKQILTMLQKGSRKFKMWDPVTENILNKTSAFVQCCFWFCTFIFHVLGSTVSCFLRLSGHLNRQRNMC